MTALATPLATRTIADLLEVLGDIPASRVLLRPAPGTATVQDLIDLHDRQKRICELVDGTLVEKAVGLRESMLAGALLAILRAFVIPRNLGIVTGEAGMMRLMAGLVRSPDVAFVSWNRIPGRCIPTQSVPHLAPDLAVEVLSKSNTVKEMERKRGEYFQAGVTLVWIVDPDTRTVAVYTSPDIFTTLHELDTLDGGLVLPGFSLPLAELFAELDRTESQPE